MKCVFVCVSEREREREREGERLWESERGKWVNLFALLLDWVYWVKEQSTSTETNVLLVSAGNVNNGRLQMSKQSLVQCTLCLSFSHVTQVIQWQQVNFFPVLPSEHLSFHFSLFNSIETDSSAHVSPLTFVDTLAHAHFEGPIDRLYLIAHIKSHNFTIYNCTTHHPLSVLA